MSQINVVFFASLREKLEMSDYQFEIDLPVSVGDLKQALARDIKTGHHLLDSSVHSSVDFEFTRDNDMVPTSAREIAFFPAVTGG
ncbi:MoaD/ThiS family protein [Marinomonas posidonica]|uniref:ThiamineS protein n=1 Tax=Marinomonas posidonica (strain CECT 7376 / NCIMB 14433 / IVIA-Po-181) TaxID=491952 RepID=F6CRT9_MARPP|nr:MoaD/ThiS family protein [Marinomonas posidonica]AEF54942.1 thiamineS protein [Marinomonas posidonica IVIA-Po-181]